MIELICLAGNNFSQAQPFVLINDYLGPMDNLSHYCTIKPLREHISNIGHNCIIREQVGGNGGGRKQIFWKSFPKKYGEHIFDEFGVRP